MWCSTGRSLSPFLFSVYIDDLIKELRQSVEVGTVFVVCILYADDIVLLSGNCYGLQKMVDICSDYGNRFGIRFNSSKSQTTVFGGRSPSQNVSYKDRLKRLKLPTLKYRRIRGDMIEVYKMIVE